jgi:hypothetical protein
MKRALLLLVPLLAATLACPPSQPLERTARDGVAAAKGYLDSAKSQHPECGGEAPVASTNCQIIYKGVAAKDSVIDALNVYCASPAYSTGGGECVPNKDVQSKLQEALNNLNQTIADVKKLGGQ